MTQVVRRGRQSAAAADRTRQDIVGAALHLFSSRGYDAVSVRDIAGTAGTAHGLIRHHFGSKEGVWRAVVDEADALFRARMFPVTTAAATTDDPGEALAVLVRGLVGASRRHPAIARLLVLEGTAGSERMDHILARMTPLREALDPLLPRLQERGLLRQFDGPSLFLFLLLSALTPFALAGLSTAVLDHDVLDDGVAEEHAQRLLRTLVAPPVDPPGGPALPHGVPSTATRG